MYILGLHNDEDSGVCLLKNGKIIDVINEERLTRNKLQGGFLGALISAFDRFKDFL